ncbi:hypothetical protein AXF42_Ash004959 [Apostasia shenzhenica]|uniref:Uncharacterized protein n=1 Tax=Apostasia shenzhenica TaxID=1088818 RepID=A0A2I0B841_9ASPA|nr:hypothetical protein AXF42_Ash004959 [Apostasia shenzhenica]
MAESRKWATLKGLSLKKKGANSPPIDAPPLEKNQKRRLRRLSRCSRKRKRELWLWTWRWRLSRLGSLWSWRGHWSLHKGLRKW